MSMDHRPSRMLRRMAVWIAFLRGINVGGSGKLPMVELASILGKLRCSDVKTYIQSGNVILRHAKTTPAELEARIGEAISKSHGFRPKVLVMGVDELEKAAAANPFRKAEADHKSLHLFFLSAKPDPSTLRALEGIKAPTESFAVIGKVFYLHTPSGFPTSKLANRAEKLLGVAATARNWRTVQTVLQMAVDCE